MSSQYKTEVNKLEQKIWGESPAAPNSKKRKQPSEYTEGHTFYDGEYEDTSSGDECASSAPAPKRNSQKEVIYISSDSEEDDERKIMSASKRQKKDVEIVNSIKTEWDSEPRSRSRQFATKKTASVPALIETTLSPSKPSGLVEMVKKEAEETQDDARFVAPATQAFQQACIADSTEVSVSEVPPTNQPVASQAEPQVEADRDIVVEEAEEEEEKQLAPVGEVDKMDVVDSVVEPQQSVAAADMSVALAFAPDWNANNLAPWAQKIQDQLLSSKVKRFIIAATATTAVVGLATYAVSYHPDAVQHGVSHVKTALRHVAGSLAQPLATYAAPRLVAAANSVQPMLASLQERIQPAFERVVDRIVPSITELARPH